MNKKSVVGVRPATDGICSSQQCKETLYMGFSVLPLPQRDKA